LLRGLRSRLKQVPGLAVAYRALRARWWRLRPGLPLGPGEKTQAGELWGARFAEQAAVASGRPSEWLNSGQVVRGYVFQHYFGGQDWYDYVRQRYCPQPREMGLSLCCGSGVVERQLLKWGICRACEGIDISPQAIAVCRRESEAAGLSTLSYRVGDVERVRLRPGAYDVAVGWMGLHHLQRLSRVFREVRRALRRGGIFIVNEYVGPVRFRMPERQVDLINEWLGRLPDELKRTGSGEVRRHFRPPTGAELMARDPTEAICSDQILPLLRRRFVVREQIDYGGVLLHWLLSGIMQNFDPENEEHRAWLQRLFAAEREVLNSGQLKSDFSFVIAQKPARTPLCEPEGGE
jgi:SAM-dependent methyltransferase